MRTKLIVGNWKMNGSHVLVDKTFDALFSKFDRKDLEIVICPPDVLIYHTKNMFKGSGIFVGSQNVYSEPNGAFTGETSAPSTTEKDPTLKLQSAVPVTSISRSHDTPT